MGEKYGTPIGFAILAYLMMNDYETATEEEKERIVEDAINFAERKVNHF